MQYRTLRLTREGAIAEIELARPDRANPIDAALLDELDTAAAALTDDDGIRVVLLTAAGDVFSHGWDTEAAPPSERRTPAFRCLELLPQPVIACVEGDAIGAGFELLLACDARIAADHVMFALPDVAMGSIPRAGGTQRLSRLAGPGTAAAMILLGDALSAEQGLTCGLVNRVVPRAEVRAAARALAERIAAMGPLAVRYAKEALVRGLDMPLDEALRYETDLTIILQTTADRAEGVAAFLEKRAPKFEGH